MDSFPPRKVSIGDMQSTDHLRRLTLLSISSISPASTLPLGTQLMQTPFYASLTIHDNFECGPRTGAFSLNLLDLLPQVRTRPIFVDLSFLQICSPQSRADCIRECKEDARNRDQLQQHCGNTKAAP